MVEQEQLRKRSGVLIRRIGEQGETILHASEFKSISVAATPHTKLHFKTPPPSELSIQAGENYALIVGKSPLIEKLQFLLWHSTAITPLDHVAQTSKEIDGVWQLYLGENPLVGTTEIFGNPGIIEVEFLGHPDEILIDLMNAQDHEYEPNLFVSFPSLKTVGKNTWKRSILKTSPVMDLVVQSEEYYPKLRTDHSYTYPAQVMFFLEVYERDNKQETKNEVKRQNIPSKLRIGVSTIDALEKKLRVYHGPWASVESFKEKKSEKKARTKPEESKIHPKDVVKRELIVKMLQLFSLSVESFKSGKISLKEIPQLTERTTVSAQITESLLAEVDQLYHHIRRRKKITAKNPKK